MSYSPDEWQELRAFTHDLFVEIDRPNAQLITLEVAVRGDGGCDIGVDYRPADLTHDQAARVLLYIADQLRYYAGNDNLRSTLLDCSRRGA
jgi:hypothetical protein